LAKRELWKLKQDQLKLKRENKVEETDKPYEVVSFKSENKMSLKERIRKERKDLDSATREKSQLKSRVKRRK
jgi:hypothetical protein